MNTEAAPTNGVAPLKDAQANLVGALPDITPRLVSEYPEVSREDVEAAANAGDAEKVVETIATMIGHTKNLITNQLQELVALHEEQTAKMDSFMGRMGEALKRVEAKSQESISYARDELPTSIKETGVKAKNTVEDNVWISLLCALGLGFVVGFFVRPATRCAPRRPRLLPPTRC